MNLMFRTFGRRGVMYPKGSFGKESSLGFNSGFPKHKELFTEGYYTGEPKAEDLDKEMADDFSSPLNQKFNEMNEKYSRDAVR